jgi:GT2 family glycosyltransferase
MTPHEVTVAIPTFGREEVLIATIEALLHAGASDVAVIDQTPQHERDTQERLEAFAAQRHIRWSRLSRPSIPAAMNHALRHGTRPVVLFVDDDIIPDPGLLVAHSGSYEDAATWAVVGQVLQPGETPNPGPHRFTTSGLRAFLDFPFNSTMPAWVANVMAGNLSVRRDRALAVGGFDENFVGVAFRFETEFCRRLLRAGGRVLFQPGARVNHLRAPRGGTRTYGDHLTSASPMHGVGDYYFALRQGLGLETLQYVLRRPVQEVCTRFHLRHPWWIAPKLIGELRALGLAVRMRVHGPSYAEPALPPPEKAA